MAKKARIAPVAGPITDEDLIREIRAGLANASKGQWSMSRMDNGYGYSVDAGDRFLCAVAARGAGIRGTSARAKADAAHMARCSPDNVARLLDRIESLTAQLAAATHSPDEPGGVRD